MKKWNNFMKKLITVGLALMMVVQALPTNTVFAATDEYPNSVTITVKDEDGNPIEDAFVSFTVNSETNGENFIVSSALTDANGVIEVMSKDDFIENDMTLSAIIKKDHYFKVELGNEKINSSTQNIDVEMVSSVITGFSFEGVTETYSGKAFDAVNILTKGEEGQIWFSLNGAQATESLPTITAAGDYLIEVRVTREGYEDYEQSVESKILPADYDISVTEYVGNYDGSEHDAIKVANVPEGSMVEYKLGADGEFSSIVPTIKNAGEYSVTVKVSGNNNYNDFEKTYDGIKINPIEIEGLTVVPYSGTYDASKEPVDAFEVKGLITGDVVEYKTENGEWTKGIPTIKDAGEYNYTVQVTRTINDTVDTNYVTTTVKPNPVTANITKAEQSFSFDEVNGETSSKTITGMPGRDTETFDFSATDTEKLVGNDIVYSIETSRDGIATIDAATGELTVSDAGTITVIATLPGNNNYNDAVIKHTLEVEYEKAQNSTYIYFENEKVNYVFGENNGVASTQTVKKAISYDMSNVTYALNETNTGLKINANTGEVAISDYALLNYTLVENNGSFDIVVTAIKPKYNSLYGGDSASYTLTVSYLDTPENPYSVAGSEGTNDWYTSKITVSPASEYKISKTADGEFTETVEFNNEGTDERYVYLQGANGGITAAILLEGIKIDTVKPDTANMSIEYSELTLIQKVAATLGFYKPEITITFKATDATSGVDHFDWTYTREDGVSNVNAETKSGTLAAKEDGTAELTLSASEAEQLRGNISFTTIDKAGNESNVKTDDGYIFVVDTISPTAQVAYNAPTREEGEVDYYDGDITATVTITEANFYADDVVIKVSKDGAEAKEVKATWKDTNVDVHVGTFTLKEDGDYVISVEYTDKSSNKMESYTSRQLTIDTIAPETGVKYSNEKVINTLTDTEGNERKYFDDVQTATITITERNFKEKEVEYTIVAKDVTGKELDVDSLITKSEWTHDGNVHTMTITYGGDANYTFDVNYKDLAKKEMKDYETDYFTVDKTLPTVVDVKYSTSLLDTILETVSFGFYNAKMTVTLTAQDDISEIHSFIYSYLKAAGVSDVNAELVEETINAEDIIYSSDRKTATATFEISKDELKENNQFNGTISFDVLDRAGNSFENKHEETKRIVVDNIAPTAEIAYNAPSREVGDIDYYNGDITATITITEANFYADDVTVKVSKDGAEAVEVTPTWSDTNVDVHVGTFTLSEDGDYVISVDYADKSTNKMESYTSNQLTIDTVKPVMDVKYSNLEVINTLKDTEEHDRQYFNAKQVATITITEHNFDENEVDFSAIVGKDVTGKELTLSDLITYSQWTHNGDVHTITITYSGDANYTFDVAYADLATNVADDYTPDYFTVDTTLPEVVSVEYSTSILETVLENITFGFYNAKMTVTLTAQDDTSEIHSMMYSYLNAEGVSGVNAELIDEIIEAANITYSEDRKTATATFEIPKMLLEGDNQFNGTVEFIAYDRAGNTFKNKHEETKRIVVDNIAPTAKVEYTKPFNEENNISYYDGKFDATITITEANFYADDVVVSITKDGVAYPVDVKWSDIDVDVHVGTFTLSEDGDYVVTIEYNDKSSNKMETYTSNQLTIDTKIDKPVITINGQQANGQAFKDDVVPSISFEDPNYDSYEITLTRTRFGAHNVNVKDTFIKGVSVSETGVTGSFNTFDKVAENDGIYTMTIKVYDKAGHNSEETITFTVNRFGSVYEYSEYLSSLIANGGVYTEKIDSDLIITEYNADRLVADSLVIEVTRDGKPLDNVEYTVTPTINASVSVGESGWFQYTYNITKENFKLDGTYKITISSKDATGNTPENNTYEDKVITFRVDASTPEITSVVGLEKNSYNEESHEVSFNIFDAMGLKSIKIYLNGDLFKEITEFEDMNNFDGTFVIAGRNNFTAQTVRIVVEDLAGNITDTNEETFVPAYEFNKEVYVSKNFFVRWYANKLAFYGSIIGGLAAVAGLWFFLAGKRKKDEEEENA